MTPSVSTILILGASGDLSARLLLPALGQLLTKQPDLGLQLIGGGQEELTPEAWRDVVEGSFKTSEATGSAVEKLLATTEYHQADVTKPAEMKRLLAECSGTPAIYFALPPAVTARVCDALAEITLPEGTQLALEKPFGVDEAGAVELNARLAKLVPENQIHRVDHFLGRSTVLNLLGLRFANRLFEPLWNGDNIAKVDQLERVSLGATFGPGQLLAYSEVLEGIIEGDPSLSVRGDTAEQCWRIVAPVLEAWRADAVALDDYAAGSQGPADWPQIR